MVNDRRRTITFVSRNPGKAREVAAVLAPFGLGVRWRRRDLVEPQAATLAEVVRAKLAAVRDVPGYVLVEDSGLFVPSLHGFPGVYS
ncbi:Ham1-like protein, partial [mine drainage metagenome]